MIAGHRLRSFDQSVSGCEHAASIASRGRRTPMSAIPWSRFRDEIFVKDGAPGAGAGIIRARLCREDSGDSSNTDPYQPAEKRHRVMRGILEFWRERTTCRHRDEIRAGDARSRPARSNGAQGSRQGRDLGDDADGALARMMEPRAATRANASTRSRRSARPAFRSRSWWPDHSAINDAEIETILTRAYAAAREAGYVMLRLPLEVRELFSEWLVKHFPDKARHVLSLIRSTATESSTMRLRQAHEGEGPYAWMIGRRFEIAAARLGFGATRLRCDLFQPPKRAGEQLACFELPPGAFVSNARSQLGVAGHADAPRSVRLLNVKKDYT